jgi:hypothetical protein
MALGSSRPAGTLQLTVFIPSVDREHQPIAQEWWVEECLAVLGRLFRGATAFPPGRGVWRDDTQGGRLIFDDTVLVTSYVDPDAMTDDTLASLRQFLHRMGREANQGEVGIVVGGSYYGITDFDHGNSESPDE